MSSPLVETLLEIAADASAVIREVYDTAFSVEWKGPKDPVTLADKRANELICRRLEVAFPGIPVVAEESDPRTFENYATADRVFFVDPLDGTAEFIDRNGEFVVMIGVVEGDVATTGVVFAPCTETAWIGERGRGAFRVRRGGPQEPISVSRVRTFAEARAVASRSHRSPELDRFLSGMGCREVVSVGSAGLKAGRVAEGGADLYVAPGNAGKRWDACAGDAIVTAAGGRFTDTAGAPFDYRAPTLINDQGLIATNGVLHEAVLSYFSSLARI